MEKRVVQRANIIEKRGRRSNTKSGCAGRIYYGNIKIGNKEYVDWKVAWKKL